GLGQKAIHHQITEVGAFLLPFCTPFRFFPVADSEFGMEGRALPPDFYPATADSGSRYHPRGCTGIAIGKSIHLTVAIVFKQVHLLYTCHGPCPHPESVFPPGLQRCFSRAVHQTGAEGSGLINGW